jgi:catechol 2,3-dioxygenase-like lactoylglutathione lyase family enzyme
VTSQFDLVTIDSPDTERAARFWMEALGLHEVEREDIDRWIVLADQGGTRRIGLQRGQARRGGVHLDLSCAPEVFTAEVDRLVSLGARLVQPVRRETYGSIANLADPDGNAFDLCAYV